MHPRLLSVLVVTTLLASCQSPRSPAVAPTLPAGAPSAPPIAAAPSSVEVTPAATAIEPAPDAVAPIALGGDRYLAVVSVAGLVDECSGAGGEHYTFAVDGSSTLLHGGGHAVYLHLVPAWGPAPPTWFVAELALVPRVDEDRDGNPDSSRSGWCLDRLPRTDGEVLRLVAAVDRADARRTLAKVAATGLPRAHVTIGTPAATDALAIVRVRERLGNGEVAVDPVVGAAPATLAVGTLLTWTGDLLVVSLAGTTATRALLADDLADARRWYAAITAGGWPPAVREVPWAGAARGARWTVVGRRAHDARCGDELRFGDGEGSQFVLRPGRAALPVGLTVTDVAAVVVPQPADACGHTVRVVRAYAADARGGRWISSGLPVTTAAVLE